MNKEITYNSIEDFYKYIDISLISVHDFHKYTRSLLNFKSKEVDEQIKKHIGYEIFCLDFSLRFGFLIPKNEIITKDGEKKVYPSFDNFSDEIHRYLLSRIDKSTNPYLLARYNHVLWASPKKHKRSAEQAINQYLILVNNSLTHPDKDINDSLEAIECAIVLSKESKANIDIVKDKYENLLFNDIYPNVLKIFLADFLVRNISLEPIFLSRLLDLCQEIYNEEIKTDRACISHPTIEELCKCGITISHKLKKSPKTWYNKLAYLYEKSARYQKDDDNWLGAMTLTKQALAEYKKASNKEKEQELGLLLTEIKKLSKLDSFSIPIPEKENDLLKAYIENEKNKLLSFPPNVAFAYLSAADILPHWENIASPTNGLHKIFTSVYFDVNNNISTPKTEKEVEKKEKFKMYGFLLQSYLHIMHFYLIGALEQGKISSLSLIEYFKDETWYGKNLHETRIDGKEAYYNWISLLAPALHEFFFQLEVSIKTKTDFANYILIEDSLAIKFEGALRDFCRIVGINTSKGNENGTAELNLEELLRQKELGDYFNENDKKLFEYVFTSNGINLRNNIAHSFFTYNKYQLTHIYLLITCFLRLGRYNLQQQPGCS